jgi:hypothetical protein
MKSPSNIEFIAKDLALNDPNHITPDNMLLYGQILEALKLAELGWLEEGTTDKWATKLRFLNQNPDSINFITNMSKDEITKNQKKIEGLLKTDELEDTSNLAGKKRRQEEDLKQKNTTNSVNLDTEQAKVIIKENQTKDQEEKKFKKDSESPRDNMLNDVQTNIENLNKKLAELEKEASDNINADLIFQDTIEDSQ